MVALNFPSSPTLNQTYTAVGRTWQWNGTSWLSVSPALTSTDITTALGYTPYNPASGSYLSTLGGTLTGALSINTGTTGGASLTITGTSSISGAQVLLQGNGTTTPNKYIRAKNGVLEILSSDGNTGLLSLTDAGALTLASSMTAVGMSSTVSTGNAVVGQSNGALGYGGQFLNNDSGVLISFNVAGSNANNRIFTGANAGVEKIYADATGNLYTTHYTEATYTVNSGTALTLSLSNGSTQLITLTGNCTFTMPTATAGKSFLVQLKTGAGAFTAAFTGVKWAGGTAPTITTTAARMDMLSFFADGTNWYGVVAGQVYTP